MKKAFITISLILAAASAKAEISTIDCKNLQPSVCPMHFAPATCSYDDVEAKGSNSCVAMESLRFALCAQTNTDLVELDENKIGCAKEQFAANDYWKQDFDGNSYSSYREEFVEAFANDFSDDTCSLNSTKKVKVAFPAEVEQACDTLICVNSDPTPEQLKKFVYFKSKCQSHRGNIDACVSNSFRIAGIYPTEEQLRKYTYFKNKCLAHQPPGKTEMQNQVICDQSAFTIAVKPQRWQRQSTGRCE